jgi:hypothetical protein
MGRAVGPVVAPAEDDVAAGEEVEARSWRLEFRSWRLEVGRKAKPAPLKTTGSRAAPVVAGILLFVLLITAYDGVL